MLLERDDLLAALDQRLDDARTGSGSMVLLAGEAGSGKTSLVRAWLERSGARALALVGACDPLSTPRPLSPLLDFAADPESGLGDVVVTAADNLEVFNALLARLRHTIRPIVLVIEDVHWADQGTLDFLRFVGRRVGDGKGVVLCTFRDDELGHDHPLRPVLGLLAPLGTTARLRVPALTVEAVATMAQGTGLDPERLHSLTGGNAFFVSEVVAGGGGLPETVQDAVLERVSRLGDGAKAIVEAVSIAPRFLRVDQALRLAADDPTGIDDAVASGVLVGDGGTLRFRHELARTAVERSIPLGRHLALHRKMVAAVLDDPDIDLARLTHHAIAARMSDLVLTHAPQAAREASRRGAHKEAVEFLRAALIHADRLEPGDEMRLRLELAHELGIVDRHQEAVEETTVVVEHHRAHGNEVDLAGALDVASYASWRAGDTAGARAFADEAVEILDPLGPSPELALALYNSAYLHMLARRRGDAVAHIERAGQVAAAAGDTGPSWSIGMMRGTIEIVLGDPETGAEMLAGSVAAARAAENRRGVAIALGMLGSGGGEARIYRAAIPALEDGIEWGVAHDEDYQVAYDRAWLARIAFEQGRWDEVEPHARAVNRASGGGGGIAVVTAEGARGRLLVRRGDPEGRAVLEEAVRLGEHRDLQHVWSPICGIAEHWWLGGDLDQARRVLEGPYRRALDTDSAWARGEVGFWAWKTGMITEPPPGSAEPFRLQMLGSWRQAAERWRAIGCPYEVALSLIEGDETAVLEALAGFDELGARPAAAMARARLRRLGVESIPRGPTRRTAANPAGLTGRQLEILGLITAGLNNVEIADRLFLSKKTVEHHVSAIYSKLGVDGRARAIARASALGVSPPPSDLPT